MVIITNMNLSRELSDLTYIYNQYGRTDLELLLEDFSGGETNWSVPKDTAPGDTVVFMCAKTAKNRLGMATSHIPDSYGDGFRAFADQQKKLYKQYSGHLLGCGVVASLPVYDSGSNRWYADVAQLRGFANPI